MSNELKQKIESLLFISGKPVDYKKIAELAGGAKEKEVEAALDELSKEYEDKGVQIIIHDKKAQMVTSGENSEVVQNFIKDETISELTNPSIEALTIIAYRGPIAKWELERIRGINCSLILRNLMLRGLVEERVDKKKRETYYNLTLDFLRHLGVNNVEELPDYEKLRNNENIEAFLKGEV